MSWKYKKHLFEIEMFWNIISVFTATFNQFNASLLERSINFFNKKQKNACEICIMYTSVHAGNWGILNAEGAIYNVIYFTPNPTILNKHMATLWVLKTHKINYKCQKICWDEWMKNNCCSSYNDEINLSLQDIVGHTLFQFSGAWYFDF